MDFRTVSNQNLGFFLQGIHNFVDPKIQNIERNLQNTWSYVLIFGSLRVLSSTKNTPNMSE